VSPLALTAFYAQNSLDVNIDTDRPAQENAPMNSQNPRDTAWA